MLAHPKQEQLFLTIWLQACRGLARKPRVGFMGWKYHPLALMDINVGVGWVVDLFGGLICWLQLDSGNEWRALLVWVVLLVLLKEHGT